ncbi:MAG TPA: hypothetical protein VJR29_11120 [bacterium]|nr:hypothetical protein [bacterium]
MPFNYYKRLNPTQKKIYQKSAGVTSIVIPGPERFRPFLDYIAKALAAGHRDYTQQGAQAFVNALTRVLNVEAVEVKVLEKRPSNARGELHGLYERGGQRPRPVITVWMRTAKRIQVVAFKTFLRTLLHEVMHHLDYTLLKLRDSFHTEGFYQRESSLLKQLWVEPAAISSPSAP